MGVGRLGDRNEWGMERAFSPLGGGVFVSWGDAPGWYRSGLGPCVAQRELRSPVVNVGDE